MAEKKGEEEEKKYDPSGSVLCWSAFLYFSPLLAPALHALRILLRVRQKGKFCPRKKHCDVGQGVGETKTPAVDEMFLSKLLLKICESGQILALAACLV